MAQVKQAVDPCARTPEVPVQTRHSPCPDHRNKPGRAFRLSSSQTSPGRARIRLPLSDRTRRALALRGRFHNALFTGFAVDVRNEQTGPRALPHPAIRCGRQDVSACAGPLPGQRRAADIRPGVERRLSGGEVSWKGRAFIDKTKARPPRVCARWKNFKLAILAARRGGK